MRGNFRVKSLEERIKMGNFAGRMGKINNIWNYLARHKYLLTVVFGVLLVGVVDENSFRKIVLLNMRQSEVEAELKECREQFERDSVRLRALNANQKGVERIARERYFMKRPNEDVYVLSTDKRNGEE